MTSAYRVPLAVRLVIGAALLVALNQFSPGTFQAVAVLIVIYLVATHGGRAAALIGTVPATLGPIFTPQSAPPATAGAGPLYRPL